MLSQFEKTKISDFLHQAMKKKGGQVVAAEMSKIYGTLMNELNSFNEDHKIGLHSAIELLDVTGEFYPLLNFLAARYDHHLAPNPSTQTAEDLHRMLTRSTKEHGEIMTAWLDATDPDSEGGSEISADEKAVLLAEISDEFKILNQLKAAVEAG